MVLVESGKRPRNSEICNTTRGGHCIRPEKIRSDGSPVAGELFDKAGNRKYLTYDEHWAFFKAADLAP